MNRQDVLDRLEYCPLEGSPETGYFKHKIKPRTTKKTWAGSNHVKGYRCIMLDKKTYPEHRLVFLVERGFLPNAIDHIDGNKRNNHISNLREATITQNGHNRGNPKSNKSGYKGIFVKSGKNPYVASIRVSRKRIHLGCYRTLAEAVEAYNTAAVAHLGEFAKLNVITGAEIVK